MDLASSRPSHLQTVCLDWSNWWTEGQIAATRAPEDSCCSLMKRIYANQSVPAVQSGKHVSTKPNRGGMFWFPPPRDALVWMRGGGRVGAGGLMNKYRLEQRDDSCLLKLGSNHVLDPDSDSSNNQFAF